MLHFLVEVDVAFCLNEIHWFLNTHKMLDSFFIILHIRFLNLIRNTDKSDRGTYK